MFCRYCGARMRSGADVCGRCRRQVPSVDFVPEEKDTLAYLLSLAAAAERGQQHGGETTQIVQVAGVPRPGETVGERRRGGAAADLIYEQPHGGSGDTTCEPPVDDVSRERGSASHERGAGLRRRGGGFRIAGAVTLVFYLVYALVFSFVIVPMGPSGGIMLVLFFLMCVVGVLAVVFVVLGALHGSE